MQNRLVWSVPKGAHPQKEKVIKTAHHEAEASSREGFYELLKYQSNPLFLISDLFQAYPSLKPLASWVTDLTQRMKFIQDWIENGIPSVSLTPLSFYMSGRFSGNYWVSQLLAVK